MKGSAPFRFWLGFTAVAFSAFVLARQCALAQHGGGHASGGHAGGGGGHAVGFGGGHSSSSHSTGVPSSSRAASTHQSALGLPSATPSSPVQPRPPVTRFSVQPLITPGVPSLLDRPGETNQPAHTTIGFPPSSTTRLSTTHLGSAPLTFAGEGHQIWQVTAPPSTAAASTIRTQQPSRVIRPQPPHIVRTLPQPVFPIAFFPSLGFFGFNPLWGFGWGPGCDPYGWWTFGCNTFGYGYGFGYGGYYPPVYWPSYSAPPDNNVSTDYGPFDWQNAPPAESNPENNGAVSNPTTLIYLTDGSSYEVTDYWVADYQLHYITNYGAENSVALNRLDFQRTVDTNAGRGVAFTLRPEPPSVLTPPPSSDSQPPTARE